MIINEPWFNFVFTLVTFLAGNLVAYLFYRRQFQPLRLFWAQKNRIVRPTPAVQTPGEEISGQGETGKGLTVSRVVIWNAGLKTISLADAAFKNPLRLSAGKSRQVLSARLLKQNNPSNQIEIELNGDSEALIKFDFLKHNNGAIFELVHRGNQVFVKGELKEGAIYLRTIDEDYLDDIPFIVLWFWAKQPLRRIIKIVFFSLCMLFLGLALPGYLFNLNPAAGVLWVIVIRLQAIFVFLVYLVCVWQMWRTTGVPKGVYEFYDAIK